MYFYSTFVLLFLFCDSTHKRVFTIIATKMLDELFFYCLKNEVSIHLPGLGQVCIILPAEGE